MSLWLSFWQWRLARQVARTERELARTQRYQRRVAAISAKLLAWADQRHAAGRPRDGP